MTRRVERFREPEIQYFDDAVVADLHVGGLQIAMDDALLAACRSTVRSRAAQSPGQRGWKDRERWRGSTRVQPPKKPNGNPRRRFRPSGQGRSSPAESLRSQKMLGICGKKLAPQVRFELTTLRLTGGKSDVSRALLGVAGTCRIAHADEQHRAISRLRFVPRFAELCRPLWRRKGKKRATWWPEGRRLPDAPYELNFLSRASKRG